MRRKWTPKEIADLRLLAELKSIQELSRLFDRSSDSIRAQCRLHNISYKRVVNRKEWSSRELERLKGLLEHYTISEAAERLGRNPKAVWAKMKQEGIKHKVTKASPFHTKDRNRVWTQEDDDLLYQMAETSSVRNIAKRMDRSPGAIRTRAMELGITWHRYRWTIGKIAELLGVGKTTVAKYRKKLKQKWRYKSTFKEPTEEEIQAIAQAILDNPRSQVKDAKRLRQIAEGNWDAWEWRLK